MNAAFPYTIFPLGDSAATISFGNSIDKDINGYVLLLFRHFTRKKYSGITDIVPGYSSLGFHYDVFDVRRHSNNKTAFEIIKQLIEQELGEAIETKNESRRRVKIPVCYASAFAPDIEWIASEKNSSIEKIIQLHTKKIYRVYMIGFLPGFSYMGEVNDALAVPRKKQPKAIVPAGSVGIAGKQTGIYPIESPGGWQIIGRTPLKLFDKENAEPVLLQPGDEIEFYSITEHEFENY